MKIIDLSQGSPAWIHWRDSGVGASDAPVIMGVDYYGVTRERLLHEKITGEKRKTNFEMRRGNRLEPLARSLYEQQLGYPHRVEPAVIEHSEHSWMRASLDGVVENHDTGEVLRICEIKCWSWDKHDSTLAGVCPAVVYPQIQHQLLCAGLQFCDLVSYTENEKFDKADQLAVLEVVADPEYQHKLFELEKAFWGEVLAGREARLRGVA
jgi:putative phage-type endonuclease